MAPEPWRGKAAAGLEQRSTDPKWEPVGEGRVVWRVNGQHQREACTRAPTPRRGRDMGMSDMGPAPPSHDSHTADVTWPVPAPHSPSLHPGALASPCSSAPSSTCLPQDLCTGSPPGLTMALPFSQPLLSPHPPLFCFDSDRGSSQPRPPGHGASSHL